MTRLIAQVGISQEHERHVRCGCPKRGQPSSCWAACPARDNSATGSHLPTINWPSHAGLRLGVAPHSTARELRIACARPAPEPTLDAKGNTSSDFEDENIAGARGTGDGDLIREGAKKTAEGSHDADQTNPSGADVGTPPPSARGSRRISARLMQSAGRGKL